MNKFFWYLVLFAALISFLVGLNTGELIFNVIAIALGLAVYKFGNKVILVDYYERRDAKQKEAKKFQDALKEGQKEGK